MNKKTLQQIKEFDEKTEIEKTKREKQQDNIEKLANYCIASNAIHSPIRKGFLWERYYCPECEKEVKIKKLSYSVYDCYYNFPHSKCECGWEWAWDGSVSGETNWILYVGSIIFLLSILYVILYY